MTTVVIQLDLARFLVDAIDAASQRGAVKGPELLSWGTARKALEDAVEAASKQADSSKQELVEKKTA